MPLLSITESSCFCHAMLVSSFAKARFCVDQYFPVKSFGCENSTGLKKSNGWLNKNGVLTHF